GPQGVPAFGLVSMIACDARDRVYVFQREPDPLVFVFEPDGRLVNRWGAGAFRHPHGIWIGPDQTVYCTDRETHTVTQWTLVRVAPLGRVLVVYAQNCLVQHFTPEG